MSVSKYTLNSLSDVIRGVTYNGDVVNTERSINNIGVLRAGNIQDGCIVEEDLKYIPTSLVNKKQFCEADDLIMCTSSGSTNIVGKTAFFQAHTPYTIGAFCAIIRAISDQCYPIAIFT